MNEIKKVIRFKKNISNEVIDFIKSQKNFSETITYLIEREVFENGIRDLTEYIPIIRTKSYFERQYGSKKENIEVKQNISSNPKIELNNKTIYKGYED